MSRSDEAKRIAQIDRKERAKRRERQEAFATGRAEAKAQAKRAGELKLLDDVKAAKAAGAMPSLAKAKHRSAVKAGKAPVLGTRTVDDPMEAGSKLKATVNLAEHPLEMMLARRRLTQAQYEAGIRFRAIYEHAMIGPGRGIDPGKIKVDGGKMGDPLSDAVLHAHFELKRLARELGQVGERIVSSICGHGLTVSELAKRWPSPDAERARMDYLAIRLREALDLLAEEVWGAKGPEHGKISGTRAETVVYDEQAVLVANQTYLRKRGISL
ncbi:hypothetical protein ACFPOB_26125 [Bosea eneae]|uniref:Uncharacterized protein n=1 Tax=Bosea eneae TaxID=151454 RepID=A0ABW0IXH5_9HYPH